MGRKPGSGIHVQLDGHNVWPDLNEKLYDEAYEISFAALEAVTKEGRAGVAIRFDTEDGRTAVGELTLRELHSAWVTLVSRHGEDFMKEGLGEKASTDDMTDRLVFAVDELTKELAAAKEKLGEPMIIDLTRAEVRYQDFKAKRARGEI